MNLFYAELMAGVGAPFRIVASGSIPLSFAADGTFVWTSGLTFDVSADGFSMIGTTSGGVTGRWTTTGDILELTSVGDGITYTFTVNGMPVDGAALGDQITAEPPANVPYSCAGPTPVINFTAGTDVDVPITLAPA